MIGKTCEAYCYPHQIHMNSMANTVEGELGYLIGGGGYYFDLPDTVRSKGVEAHPCGTSSTRKLISFTNMKDKIKKRQRHKQ
jgi:hypothetical protein